jgi:hypothetical protein
MITSSASAPSTDPDKVFLNPFCASESKFSGGIPSRDVSPGINIYASSSDILNKSVGDGVGGDDVGERVSPLLVGEAVGAEENVGAGVGCAVGTAVGIEVVGSGDGALGCAVGDMVGSDVGDELG